MKIWILNKTNAILGTVAAFLAGCGTINPPIDGPGEVICMYGVPPEVLQRNQEIEDSIQNAEKQKADTVQYTAPAPQEESQPTPPRPMVKYGPRPV